MILNRLRSGGMILKREGATRRKLKGAATKNTIYETAEKLFALHNFNDVSVNDIVRAAGVSKGTFYVHFESKDALIASFIEDYVKKVDFGYRAHLDALPPDLSTPQMLLSLIEKIADTLVYGIGVQHMRTVYKLQLAGDVGTEVVKGYGRALYQIFGDVLNRGIMSGEFRCDIPQEELTRHFVMAIRGISYEWCIRYPDFDLKARALAHFSLLIAAVERR